MSIPRRTGLTEDILKWCRKQKTIGAVRFTSFEYSRLPQVGQAFYHYNLSPCSFYPTQYYAGLEIIKNGCITEKKNQDPILNLDSWTKLLCLSTTDHISPQQLSLQQATANDLFVTTPKEIIASVWEKYHPVLPGLSYEEFLTAGLCVSQFLVVKKD